MRHPVNACLYEKQNKVPRNQRAKVHVGAMVIGLILFLFLGCRSTLIRVSPENPKQGDRVSVTIDNRERDEVDHVDYTVGSISGTTARLPHVVEVNTCKDTGTYMTQLTANAVTTYEDGDTGSRNETYDLTVGLQSTEDSDNQYSVYVAHDGDDDLEDLMVDMANAFRDEFDSLAESHYFWSEPRFYTNQCVSYANAADLVVSFGHGNHHRYYTGSGSVNLSNSCFGNFVPCRRNGDAEYLAFASCQTLSMSNSGGNAYRYFWRNTHATRLDDRPFSGLHMVMGFRTNFVVSSFLWWSDGEDFLEEFASNLDSGDRVVDAWQEAVGDELDFDDGNNRGTVFYLRTYENDTVGTAKDDYIYGNTHYVLVADYWE